MAMVQGEELHVTGPATILGKVVIGNKSPTDPPPAIVPPFKLECCVFALAPVFGGQVILKEQSALIYFK